jgi:FAD/FMN-containing dehydrogenase
MYENIMDELQGRPHWAKAYPLSSDQLARKYPQFETFCKLRLQLDPEGRFLNDYARRHLLYTQSQKAKL